MRRSRCWHLRLHRQRQHQFEMRVVAFPAHVGHIQHSHSMSDTQTRRVWLATGLRIISVAALRQSNKAVHAGDVAHRFAVQTTGNTCNPEDL
jgi:hypothetical protein